MRLLSIGTYIVYVTRITGRHRLLFFRQHENYLKILSTRAKSRTQLSFCLKTRNKISKSISKNNIIYLKLKNFLNEGFLCYENILKYAIILKLLCAE